MRKNRWWILCGAFLATAVTTACFPTTQDVNTMAEAERTYVGGLHDASNELMTEQHSAMTPELAEAFAAMKGQYNDLAAQLAAKAGETTAAGVGFAGVGSNGITGFVGGIMDMLGLGWIATLFLPSRGAKKMNELEMALATKAGTGETIPG